MKSNYSRVERKIETIQKIMNYEKLPGEPIRLRRAFHRLPIRQCLMVPMIGIARISSLNKVDSFRRIRIDYHKFSIRNCLAAYKW